MSVKSQGGLGRAEGTSSMSDRRGSEPPVGSTTIQSSIHTMSHDARSELLHTEVAKMQNAESPALSWALYNLANIIEHSPNAIITVDVRGTIDVVNAQGARLFGYTHAELRGRPIECLIPPNAASHHESLRQSFMREPSARPMGGGRNLKGLHKDGTLIDVEVALAPLMDGAGNPTGVVATIIDIRQRLEAERMLARQLEQLTRSNEELDRFAYVASHDLKAPLNAIQRLVSWIEEDCEELLPDPSKKHLYLLKQRAQRLMRLLDDLLAYSRVGRLEYSVETVDLAVLCDEIFYLQGAPEGFTCKTDSVSVTLPRMPLETALRNLISNAVKHHDRDTAHIQVRCHVTPQAYSFCVEDDGPGIPPELHDRAMAMFQTLRPRDEVEGSGMGLALVKKIVEHHHGSLRIDSDGHRGTRIWLRWPRLDG